MSILVDLKSHDRRTLEEVLEFIELIRSVEASKATIIVYVEEGKATSVAIQNMQKPITTCKVKKTAV